MATPKFFLKSRVYCILWINLPEKNLFKINLLTSENLYISFFLDIINFLLNFHSISKPFLLHSSQTVICQFSNLLSMRIIGIWNFWNKILKLKFIYSEKATKFDKLFWKMRVLASVLCLKTTYLRVLDDQSLSWVRLPFLWSIYHWESWYHIFSNTCAF